jgi:integrase
MRGKQAKVLSDDNLQDLLLFAETSRHPLRNKVIVLLSAKAGLRAGEIANLTWPMVTDPTGAIGIVLQLPRRAAKRKRSRYPVARRFTESVGGVASRDQFGRPSDRVGAEPANDRAEYCGLVCQCVSDNGPRRVFVPFRASHVHHAGSPARSPSWRVLAGRSTIGRAQIDPDDPAIHRRRH